MYGDCRAVWKMLIWYGDMAAWEIDYWMCWPAWYTDAVLDELWYFGFIDGYTDWCSLESVYYAV